MFSKVDVAWIISLNPSNLSHIFLQLSEPETFNAYLRKLKDELKELLKVDFWQDVTKGKITGVGCLLQRYFK